MTQASGVVAKLYSDRAVRRHGPFGSRYYTIIYAIEAPGTGRIKFGRTLDIERRMSSLSTASPVPLVLRGHVWLPDDAEADIHSFLRLDRSHGEWFCVSEQTRAVAALIGAQKVRELAEIVGIRGYLGDVAMSA